MTIAELREQKAKGVNATFALEQRLADFVGPDRWMVEGFNRRMIKDMRKVREKESASMMASQEKAMGCAV